MLLTEFRQRYPQYDDLSDAELADGLYRKFYSDVPRFEFDQKIGLGVNSEPAWTGDPNAIAAPPDLTPRFPGGTDLPSVGFEMQQPEPLPQQPPAPMTPMTPMPSGPLATTGAVPVMPGLTQELDLDEGRWAVGGAGAVDFSTSALPPVSGQGIGPFERFVSEWVPPQTPPQDALAPVPLPSDPYSGTPDWQAYPGLVARGAAETGLTMGRGLEALPQQQTDETRAFYDEYLTIQPGDRDTAEDLVRRVQRSGMTPTRKALFTRAVVQTVRDGSKVSSRDLGIDVPIDTATGERYDRAREVLRETFPASQEQEQSLLGKTATGFGSTFMFLPFAGIPGGVWAAGALAGAGEASERAYRAGASSEQQGTATALGMVPGAIDALSIDSIIRGVTRTPGAAGWLRSIVLTGLRTGAIEGSTEGVQQAVQNVIARVTYDPDAAIAEGVPENALVGFLSGGALGAAGGVFSRPDRSPVATSPDRQEPPALDVSRGTETERPAPDDAVAAAREARRQADEVMRRAAETRARNADRLGLLPDGSSPPVLPGPNDAQTFDRGSLPAGAQPGEAIIGPVEPAASPPPGPTPRPEPPRVPQVDLPQAQGFPTDRDIGVRPVPEAELQPGPEAPAVSPEATSPSDRATSPIPTEPRSSEPVPAPAAADAARSVPAAPVATFQTAKGSTYQLLPDGTTVRDKAARPEHPGDFGPQPRSDRTIYIDMDVARALAPPASASWRMIDHGDGTVSLGIIREDGRIGIPPSARNLAYQTDPAVGMVPLELWQPEQIRDQVFGYRKIHFGNEITAIADAAPPATTMPEPAAAPSAEARTERGPSADAAPALAGPLQAARIIDSDTAITPAGTDVPVRYAVVEMDSLIPSQTDDGDPNPRFTGEQPRDRSRAASQAQVAEIASRLDPRRLDRNPSTADGAPLVGPDGMVDSGNGRILAIRRAYRQGLPSAARYKQHLVEQGYPVEGMQRPVLVRINDAAPDLRARIASESNARSTLAMSATEQAMADARAMATILPTYRGGDVTAAVNRDFVRRFIDQAVGAGDRASVVDSQGQLSGPGIRRIQAAMLAAAYGDANIVETLVESADSDIKAIGGALVDAAPEWAQMRQEAEAGQIDPAVADVTKDLLEAVRLVQRARAEGQHVADLAAQMDMFGGRTISVRGEAFLRLFFRDLRYRSQRGRPRIAQALTYYATEARKTQPGPGLFGDADRATADGIIENARRQADGPDQQQGDLLGSRPARDGRDGEGLPPAGGDPGRGAPVQSPDGAGDRGPAAEPARGADAGGLPEEPAAGGVRGRADDGARYQVARSVETAPPFYSALTRAVEAVKIGRGPREQWLGIVRNLVQKGVKQAEIEWSGIETWLRDVEGPITKDKVLDYLRSQEVQVQEVEKSATDAKWGQYTLPGGENYRELLLTLPRIPSRDEIAPTETAMAPFMPEWDRIVAELRDARARGDVEAETALTAEQDALHARMIDATLAERGGLGGQNYTTPHFEEPNVLAHIRFNERTGPNGERVLFIEEIQSDWHQAGRKKGYRTGALPELFTVRPSGNVWEVRHASGGWVGDIQRSEAASESDALRLANSRFGPAAAQDVDVYDKRVPDAPFKTTWHETAFRRAVRWAAENGFDRVAWTTGDMQAERFDLSKQISELTLHGTGNNLRLSATDHSGTRVIDMRHTTREGLADLIGKEPAERLLAQPEPTGPYSARRLSGLDLKVGGEGMRGFYDRILPAYANKFGKPFGARAETAPVSADGELAAHSLPITPEMRESVLRDGVPLWQSGRDGAAPAATLDPEALKAELRRIAPLASLEVIERIAVAGRGPMNGAYYPAFRGIVVAATGPDPMQTLRHEAIHALRDLNLIRPEEWRRLAARAEAEWIGRYDIEARYPSLSREGQIEEAVAEAFADHETRPLPPGLRSVWENVKRFLDRLGAWLRGQGFQTVEDVLGRIERGEVGARDVASGQGRGTAAAFQAETSLTEQQIADELTPFGVTMSSRTDSSSWSDRHGPSTSAYVTATGNGRSVRVRMSDHAPVAPTNDVDLRYWESPAAAAAKVLRALGMPVPGNLSSAIDDDRARRREVMVSDNAAAAMRVAEGHATPDEAQIIAGGRGEIVPIINRIVERAPANRRAAIRRALMNIRDDARSPSYQAPRLREDEAPAPVPPAQRSRSVLDAIKDGQPIDRIMRLPFRLLGGVTERGEWKPGLRLADWGAEVISERKLDPSGRFAWLNPAIEKARAGLIDRYGQDPEYVARDRQRQNEETRRARQGLEIVRGLIHDGMDANEAAVLQAVLTGEPIPPGKWEKVAPGIRAAIDEMGAEAMALGLISAESYERNRGAYLNRSYLKHETTVEGGGLGKLAQNMGRSQRVKLIGSELKGRGIFLEIDPEEIDPKHRVRGTMIRVLDDARPDTTGKMKNWARAFVPAGEATPARFADWTDKGAWEVRQTAPGKLVLWRDYTKAERERMGEILDARYTIAKTFYLMAHDLATGRFYQDIATNEAWATKMQPPEGTWVNAREANIFAQLATDVEWVKVPDTAIEGTAGVKKWGALAGMYVRSEIWRDLNQVAAMANRNAWDYVLSQWKLNKTARSPVTHMNNVMSNVLFMDMNDVRLQDLVDGARSYMAGDQDFKEAEANGAFGTGFVGAEIKREVLEPILREIEAEATGKKSVGQVTRWLNQMGAVGRLMATLGRAVKKADEKMLAAYRAEDDVFRMALYKRRRAMGDSAEAAANAAREVFLDYDIRAPWVNAARRTVLPFIAYTYRAVPGVARAVATKPWKLAKYALLAQIANWAAYAMWPGDEDEERRNLRKDQRGYTWIGSPRMLRLWVDGDGPNMLDVRRWIPAGDVFDLNQGSPAVPLPSWLQLGGPLQVGIEMMMNRSNFTGRDIVNKRTDDALDQAGKVADYLWKSWAPSAVWVPGGWYQSKVADALSGVRDRTGNQLDPLKALISSFGIKVQGMDLNQAKYWRQAAYETIKRDIAFERNRAIDDHARGAMSDSAYRSTMADLAAKEKRAEAEVADILKDAAFQQWLKQFEARRRTVRANARRDVKRELAPASP